MAIPDSYFAGIVDGEGCITFYTNGKAQKHCLAVAVLMTCLPILQALQSRFGGNISMRKKEPSRKQQWSYKVLSNEAYECIKAIRPWLIEKASQADLALEAREWQTSQPRGASTLEAYVEKAQWYNNTIKSLKHVN